MTMLTPGRFIRAMQKTPILLDALLNGVTQERALAARDGADGWNVVEIMCHLRDFEEIFFARARQIVEQDRPTLDPFDHEQMAKDRDYAGQDLNAAFETYQATRQEFLAWLKARAEADWQRVGAHPEAGEYTLLEQALQVPLHDLDHLEQIARVLGLPDDASISPLELL
ncbi:MAG: DinB family protein [Anaerolineae bacterium]|nr:DinB family protein [Anaerolineae bacterium]